MTGIDAGRYPIRDPGSERTDAVLVVRNLGAKPPPRRRFRRAKPTPAETHTEPESPVSELTLVEANELGGDSAAWLERLREDPDARDELADAGLRRAARAVGAQRVAAADYALADPTLQSALTVRIGYGDGERLVEGEWDEAIELPTEAPRRSRAFALRPQERLAGLLGGHEESLACEELLLRGRSDLEAGRTREAALQLRVALEALLAARAELAQEGQDEDLAFLEGRKSATVDAAHEALSGPLSEARRAEVAETLSVCERVLRRRTALR